jgi:hypothetical protein
MVVQRLSRSLLRQSTRLGVHSANASPSSVSTRCLSSSPWSPFEMAPVDPIVGLNELYQKDDFPQKVAVGVGAYRDDNGKPYVLPCVREAEQILMAKNLDMEYTGIVSAACRRAPTWRNVPFDGTPSCCTHRPCRSPCFARISTP